MKGYGEAGGTHGNVDYRVSASRNAGDGYRVHTAFDATNIYGKALPENRRFSLMIEDAMLQAVADQAIERLP